MRENRNIVLIIITIFVIVSTIVSFSLSTRSEQRQEIRDKVDAVQGNPTLHRIGVWEDTERGVVCYVLEQYPYRSNAIDCVPLP